MKKGSCSSIYYVGCYADVINSATRDLNGLNASPNTAGGGSIESCFDYCYGKGFTYTGAQFSLEFFLFVIHFFTNMEIKFNITLLLFWKRNECYCGNSYGSYGTASSRGVSCNLACSSNSNEICGGSCANSIYMCGERIFWFIVYRCSDGKTFSIVFMMKYLKKSHVFLNGLLLWGFKKI